MSSLALFFPAELVNILPVDIVGNKWDQPCGRQLLMGLRLEDDSLATCTVAAALQFSTSPTPVWILNYYNINLGLKPFGLLLSQHRQQKCRAGSARTCQCYYSKHTWTWTHRCGKWKGLSPRDFSANHPLSKWTSAWCHAASPPSCPPLIDQFVILTRYESQRRCRIQSLRVDGCCFVCVSVRKGVRGPSGFLVWVVKRVQLSLL